MTPSELLSRAADLVRDTAEKATDGPWRERFDAPGRIAGPYGSVVCELRSPMADGRWIALASPALAPHLELILRHVAERWAKTARIAAQYDASADDWMTDSDRAMLALARVVLGERGDTDD